jgi:hypothetical protein
MMEFAARSMLRFFAALVLTYFAACDSPVQPGLPAEAMISISPDPVPMLIAGMAIAMQAQTSGNVSVAWSSSDTMVADVDVAGNVAARKPGNAYIIAVAKDDTRFAIPSRLR